MFSCWRKRPPYRQKKALLVTVLTAGEASERAEELAGSRISSAATSIIFVATNICRDKHNYFCRDKLVRQT